jgi:cytoskeletal protein CcmA (bactofilin family)
VSTGTLIVGPKPALRADLRVGQAVSSGEVVRSVQAERVELKGGARVFGDIEAPIVVIEGGVLSPARDLSVVHVER